MATNKLHLETLALHVGQEQADPTTDSRAVPIYQTASSINLFSSLESISLHEVFCFSGTDISHQKDFLAIFQDL